MALLAAALPLAGSLPARAAEMSKLTVLSSLGQPLLAEIEIVSLHPDEADTLRARLATPGSFRKAGVELTPTDRKSTRLNSSHQIISYAVFCLDTKITLLCSGFSITANEHLPTPLHYGYARSTPQARRTVATPRPTRFCSRPSTPPAPAPCWTQ